VLAIVLDAIYQFIAFRAFHLVGALCAALILAFLPYLIIRGPANRIARWCASGPKPTTTAEPRRRS
jgi:hypothetical protein